MMLIESRIKKNRPHPMEDFAKEKAVEIFGIIHEGFPDIEKISDWKYEAIEKALVKHLCKTTEEVVYATAVKLKVEIA